MNSYTYIQLIIKLHQRILRCLTKILMRSRIKSMTSIQMLLQNRTSHLGIARIARRSNHLRIRLQCLEQTQERFTAGKLQISNTRSTLRQSTKSTSHTDSKHLLNRFNLAKTGKYFLNIKNGKTPLL